jgi:hypothetical protein
VSPVFSNRHKQCYICADESAAAVSFQLSEHHVQNRLPASLVLALAVVSLFAACATPNADIIRTLLDPAAADFRFSNVLVISVAGNYAERAQTEQALAATLTGSRTTASPYYAVIGRNPQVTRNLVNTAIQSRRFDAVLFVRLQGQDIANAAPGRPTGRNFQLFLYDYEEFNRPAAMSLASTVTLVSELYAAASEEKIWAIESLIFQNDSVTDVIELQARSIAAQIKADGLTAD